ncbi:MAG TPA: AraC family transcriptional regulator ligand-binding domain-containing protein [Polyangiaceae bacterium]|nr:AraC family transcriptional regulator ligand-binding domain-containing protein [Polyangiaceae bacterium]
MKRGLSPNRSRSSLPLVKSTVPSVLRRFCAQHGVLVDAIAARYGVSREDAESADAWLPYEYALELWDALIAAVPEQPVGVHFGAVIGFFDLGVVGLAAAHASTIAEAFATFAPLGHLLDPALEIELKIHEQQRVIAIRSHAELLARVHPMEAMLVSTNVGLGRLTQAEFGPLRVEFARPPRGLPEVYMAQFGVLPELTDRYALTYAAQIFELPIAGAHPLVLKYLVEHAQAQNVHKHAENTTVARVSEWLEKQAGSAGPRRLMECRLSDVARGLATSRRELQRRLAAEGTTFRALQDEAGRARAHELLARGDASVAQIAEQLGYAEPRSFQRACYRWFQAAPGAHRRGQN